MRRIAAIAALILVAGLATGARADIWRWVDTAGHLHYSDHPAPGAVLIKHSERGNEGPSPQPADTPSPASQPSSAPQATDADSTSDAARQAAKQAVSKDEAAARAAECTQAKEKYGKMIQARHIYSAAADGTRKYLTDEQADAARVQARIEMDSVCGSDSP